MSSGWTYENWIAASWDRLQRGRHILLGIEKWIFRQQSEYQEVAIGTVPELGDGLFLDAVVEFLAIDEFVYHESMALPPLLFHPAPKRVLIEGGGDGLVLREVLRDPRVEEVVMVELDGLVIDACKAHLAHLHRGSFDDPRARILVRDVFPYLEEGAGPFDVVLVDLLDAYDTSALRLYGNVLDLSRNALAPGGILGGFGDLARPQIPVRYLYRELTRLFPRVVVHRASIETYGGPYGFLLASKDVDFRATSTDVIEERAASLTGELRALVPSQFPACFEIPRYVREALDRPAAPAAHSLADHFSWLYPDR